MRWVVLLMCLIGFAVQSVADPYQRFEEKGKIGLKDNQGNVVLPAAFEALGWSDGSFSMAGEVTGFKANQRWGLIHLSKKKLTDAIFLSLVYPGGECVVAQKPVSATRAMFGCLTLKGEVKIPFVYDHICVEGLRAVVVQRQGTRFRSGLVDFDHRTIIPVQYNAIRPLGTLRYAVENDQGKMAVFTEEGKPISGFAIDSIAPFVHDRAVYHIGLRQGLMDRAGTFLTPAIYARIQPGEPPLARTPTVWSLVNQKNEVIASTEGDWLEATAWGFVVRDNGRAGLLYPNLAPQLTAIYEDLVPVSGTLTVAKQKGRWGLWHVRQGWVIAARHDTLRVEGDLVRTCSRQGGQLRWQLWDTLGILKTPRSYEFIAPAEGHAHRVRQNGHWGLLDRTGREFVLCVYDSLLAMRGPQVAVRYRGQFGIINKQEQWLVRPQPHPVQLISDEVYGLQQQGQQFLMGFDGNIIYFTDNRCTFYATYFEELLPTGEAKKVGYDGVLMERFHRAEAGTPPTAANEGFVVFKRDGKAGFLDARGRIRIANRYDDARPFQEGLAAFKILNRWGFLNAQEQIVVQPAYDHVSDFSSGLAVVGRAGRFGLIDAQGKVILALAYDRVVPNAHGHYDLQQGGKKGLASGSGKLLLEPTYEFMEQWDATHVRVKRNGTWGIITTQGLTVVPLLYDQALPTATPGLFLVARSSGWKELK
ncbi:MAG: WG repeat-containing protein [Cyclobacteriaceae bacterium]|jgi:hypothetical protein|nr:WG repeat-containing protein [Cyclobacteriaceae bacterium]